MFPKDGSVRSLYKIVDFASRVGRGLFDSVHVRNDKKQLMGIDVAFVDEPFCFLCTAAGVTRVYQTAPAIHELIEIAAGTCEALPKIVGRHIQNLTADRVTDAENFAKREN